MVSEIKFENLKCVFGEELVFLSKSVFRKLTKSVQENISITENNKITTQKAFCMALFLLYGIVFLISVI